MISALDTVAPQDRRELLESLLLKRHRQAFPTLASKAFFNFGAQGLLPRPALAALLSYHDEIERAAPLSLEGVAAMLLTLRRSRAALAVELGAREENLALVENASTGCNIALWGIDWQPGDHLVVSDREYPGVREAAAAVARRFGLTVTPWRIEGASDRQLAGLEACLTPRTRAVLVSHVPWDTGEVLPLAEISALCQRPNGSRILLLVDGAQSAGVLPLDLPALGVDVYAFPGHKWWCGPEGTGGLYVGPAALAELSPVFVGSRGLTFSREGVVTGFRADAARFEVGTSSPALCSALAAAVAVHGEWGTSAARLERIHKLVLRLWEGLGALGPRRVLRLQPLPPQAGLVFFRPHGIDPQALVLALEARNLVVRSMPHADCVRASVHYFNQESEVDELLAALEALCPQSREQRKEREPRLSNG
jgi:L-cysteine/cystine lyase